MPHGTYERQETTDNLIPDKSHQAVKRRQGAGEGEREAGPGGGRGRVSVAIGRVKPNEQELLALLL